MADSAAPGKETVVPPAAQPPGPRQHKRHPWIWVVVAVVLIGIALLAYFRRQKPKTPPPPPLTVSTTNAFRGDIEVTVTALGSVTPLATVGLSPRVDGQIVALHYTEGQIVQTNDLLIEIDPGPYQAMETVAEGELARDKAMLEAANIDLRRYQAAYDKKAIPQQQVQDQEALVHQDEGVVKLDEGNLANAQVQLHYCSLRAPIAGRVGLRLVDPGNIVHASNTNAMAIITQLQPITVIFSVAEDYLPQIMRQLQAAHPMSVEAYDRAQENRLATGQLLTLDNLIDTSTGTIRIKALFPNDDLSLFPNQFINAKLIIDTLRDQTLIPTPAIQRNPQGAFVYVVTNLAATNLTATNSATNLVVTMRNITVGVTDQNITAVEGLAPGETIVTDNFNKLGEGTKISVREPNAQGKSAGGKQGQGGRGKMTNGPPRQDNE